MRELLMSWNRDLLNDEFVAESVDKKFLNEKWLGNSPTTSDDIEANEERLGAKLPPSYRSFLEVANGWCYPGNDMDFPGMLRPVERVEWAKDGEAYVVSAFAEEDSAPRVADREYFVYGPDQDTEELPIRHLFINSHLDEFTQMSARIPTHLLLETLL